MPRSSSRAAVILVTAALVSAAAWSQPVPQDSTSTGNAVGEPERVRERPKQGTAPDGQDISVKSSPVLLNLQPLPPVERPPNAVALNPQPLPPQDGPRPNELNPQPLPPVKQPWNRRIRPPVSTLPADRAGNPGQPR